MRVFTTFEELEAAAGEQIGTSEWVTIDQHRVNVRADRQLLRDPRHQRERDDHSFIAPTSVS